MWLITLYFLLHLPNIFSYQVNFTNNTSRALPLYIQVVGMKPDYSLKYEGDFNGNVLAPYSSGSAKIQYHRSTTTQVAANTAGFLGGGILGTIAVESVTQVALCFKDIYTYWDGKKIDLMKYHKKSTKISGCENVYAIIEEKTGGQWHRMVWSKLDPNHKHYNDYLKKHRTEMERKKAPLIAAAQTTQAKINRCNLILHNKSHPLSPSDIQKLKAEIEYAQKRITSWQQKKKDIGLSAKEENDLNEELKNFKQQQDTLDLATQGAQYYKNEGCKDVLGKEY